jgi:hypothetical protein
MSNDYIWLPDDITIGYRQVMTETIILYRKNNNGVGIIMNSWSGRYCTILAKVASHKKGR